MARKSWTGPKLWILIDFEGPQKSEVKLKTRLDSRDKAESVTTITEPPTEWKLFCSRHLMKSLYNH